MEMNKDPFEQYIREKEPEKTSLGYAWQTGVGLQAVDGLTTSDYLIETAKKDIDGEITMKRAGELIDGYYREHTGREIERTEEADKVSVRIAKILAEKALEKENSGFVK